MPSFRKRPVIIEATRVTTTEVIETREGTLKAYPGDWLITGLAGEKYPCNDEVFRATYEPVDREAKVMFDAVSGPWAQCTCTCDRLDCVRQCCWRAKHTGIHDCGGHART